MINPGEVIPLKDKFWIAKQKYAGNVVAKVHQNIFKMIKGMSNELSLKILGESSEEIIIKNNCTPTFLNYQGFPSPICTSLNNEIVHGFTRDIKLKEGDVIKVDVGATFEGAIADCAFTYIFGKTNNENIGRMLISCQQALNEGIQSVKTGLRIGVIGKAIWERAKQDGFGVITAYGGHGIGNYKLHDNPFVPNKSNENFGIVIQPGLSIAIEPMFVLSNNTNTKTLKDKWTVITKDIGCHFEHSVTLDEDGKVNIITEHGLDVKDFLL